MKGSSRPAASLGIRFPAPTDADLVRERRLTALVFAAAALAGIAGAVLFIFNPTLDLDLIAGLHDGDNFLLERDRAWSLLRSITMWGYAAFYVLTVAAVIWSWRRLKPLAGLYAVQWLYLVLCSVAGPLLIANVWLKDNIGRPRPRTVEVFGGPEEFIPVFGAGGQCVGNCSFVSGEVSSMVMIFASLMFIGGRARMLFAALLPLAWALSAWMRTSVGAHFPSDVFFAGVFMILVAAALYWIMFLGNRGDANDTLDGALDDARDGDAKI